MKVLILFTLCSVLLISALCACSPVSSEQSIVTEKVILSQTTGNLSANDWSLKSYGEINNMTQVISGVNITLTFNKDLTSYGGSDGYNQYKGSVSVRGERLAFMSKKTSTDMQVQDNPPGFLQQVETYYMLLRQANIYNISNSELLINCGNNQTLLFSAIN
jgi:heat shock protein HslJ